VAVAATVIENVQRDVNIARRCNELALICVASASQPAMF